MKAIPVPTTHFSFDGRGPSLIRYIHDRDIDVPDSTTGRAARRGAIAGAVYETDDEGFGATHFVVFRGLQVLQVVPHEVHSYWYAGSIPTTRATGIHRIDDSRWLASFQQRHLEGRRGHD